MVGLQTSLFYFKRRPQRLTGNLLLAELAGARMHFLPFDDGKPAPLSRINRMVGWLARLRCGRHYFIPVGGHSCTGCLGYVRAARELDQQARDMDIADAHVITATGTGGTLAGLLAGVSIYGSRLRPLGIDIGALWTGFPRSIAAMVNRLCDRLGHCYRTAATDVPVIEHTWVGERYGEPTAASMAAIRRLLRTDGVLLDPIYTGKALAGMLDLIAAGHFGPDDPIIFLHTGGAPGLLAFDAAALSSRTMSS
jgi:1-aminocyclopropane-1-carboxylate deaminase/D-cysteine desulfhydrase-like pyridoxal-dependent ACC family enzyme